MELIQPRFSWRAAWSLNEARERVAAILMPTHSRASPHTLRPSQIVSPMSDEWMHEFARSSRARRGDQE
jgi:hypothetical protein